MAITKSVMKQYMDLQQEIADLNEDIGNVEQALEDILALGTVKDSVRGGMGGVERFHVEGFPVREYDRKIKSLRTKQLRLKTRENELIDLCEEIEHYIDCIPDSRDRKVFRRYFLKGQTQQQIAREMYIDQSRISRIITKYASLA